MGRLRQQHWSGRRINLAWAQLTHRKVRLAVALSGIAFANVLIFMQLGFRALFTTGATALPENLAGDLFMVQPEARFIGAQSFERIRLVQAAAIAGVEEVAPLYVNGGAWAYSRDHISFDTRVFAFNLQRPVFRDPALLALLPSLKSADTMLFDQLSRDDLGPVAQQFQTGRPVQAIVNNQRLEVVGLFKMGNSFFVGEGNVLLSEATYQGLYGSQALDQVSIGVIWLKSEVDGTGVGRQIEAKVPGVKVLTRSELLNRETEFQASSPAGPIFSFGAVMGLAQHPDVRSQLHQELQSVLHGRKPAIADLPQLPYTNHVIREAMRLYPPVTDVSRQATRNCEIGGYKIPKGCTLIASQWVMHRDPRYFEQPERFNPGRWADDLEKRLPRGVYFPFGDGPRVCIGKSFAQMEAVLILAAIAQEFQLDLVPNQAIELQPSITLRPKHGLQVVFAAIALNPFFQAISGILLEIFKPFRAFDPLIGPTPRGGLGQRQLSGKGKGALRSGFMTGPIAAGRSPHQTKPASPARGAFQPAG
jgi:DevC protein